MEFGKILRRFPGVGKISLTSSSRIGTNQENSLSESQPKPKVNGLR